MRDKEVRGQGSGVRIFLTQVLHPQISATPAKCSRPEKFFKVKFTNTMVKQEKPL